jgi:hypothetical protein
MGSPRCIEIDGTTVYFVQHGMKGSFGGVWYEMQTSGGYAVGKIESFRKEKSKLWRGWISRYENAMGPFRSRLELATAMLAEYRNRKQDHPAYFKNCEKNCTEGCRSCYAGKE